MSQTANLISCAANHGIPFIFGGTQASLDANFQTFYGSNGFEGTMTFVRQNGSWRIDSMTPDLFLLSS